ncbi:unnamed protein product [Triticum turgidum subsp. durum]|uniref:Uncharacterized protein n=1 Tax=Triticum turgidum subsp. durum TaxID=4567 RepID=A0A9R1PIP4_TRITD|nr:unnamed protein product [Triticum turgidum subsp. durum]
MPRWHLSLTRITGASPSRAVVASPLAQSLSPLMCRGTVTRPHRHDQGDNSSPTPPPSARSNDNSKLCGTACSERCAAGAPPPQPPAWPTTRPRPHRCRRPATRPHARPARSTRHRGPPPAASAGQETETPPAPGDLGISIDRLSKRYLARLPHC